MIRCCIRLFRKPECRHCNYGRYRKRRRRRNRRSGISYPAAYDETIAVGAIRYDNARSQYSNYGTGLDITAPAEIRRIDQNGDGSPDGILQQTFPGSCYVGGATSTTTFDYLFCQGTSMAAPTYREWRRYFLSTRIFRSRHSQDY